MKRAVLPLLTAILVIGLPPTVAAASEKTVTLVEPEYGLDETPPDATIEVLYTVDKADVAVTAVTVVDVVNGAERNQRFTKAFVTAELAAGNPPRIVLTIRAQELWMPGDYKVTLQLTLHPTKSDAGADTQELATIKIKKSSPKVSVTKTSVIVEIVDGPFGSRQQGRVTVTETSKHNALSALTGRHATGPSESKGDGVTLSVALQESTTGAGTTRIEPGGSAKVIIDAAGDIPLGTVTGTVEIDSEQLEPTSISVTVKRRYTTALIVVLFMLGGMAGWLVRILAPRRLAYIGLRERADKVLAELAPLIQRSRKDDRDRLEAETTKITDAAQRKDNKTFTAVLDEATTVVNDVKSKHDNQLASLKTGVAALSRVGSASLLVELKVPLDGYDAAIAAVEQAVATRDVAGADRELKRVQARLESARTAFKSWQPRIETAVSEMRGVVDRAPRAIRDSWPDDEPLDELAAAGKATTTTELIDQASKPVDTLDNRVVLSARALVQLAKTAKTTLQRHKALANQLAAAVAFTANDLPSRIGEIESTVTAWHALLTNANKINLDTPALKDGGKEVATFITSGDFASAFTKLEDLAQAPSGKGAADTMDVRVPIEPQGQRSAGLSLAMAGDATDPPPSGVPLLTAEHLAERAIWNWALSAVVFTGLTGLAFLAYKGTFVGTCEEWVAMFAAGFTTNFTTDTAIARLGEFAPKKK